MMLMHGSLDDLKDWRQLRHVEYLAEVKSQPESNLRWLYESGNGTSWSGGILVEYDGLRVRRVNGEIR